MLTLPLRWQFDAVLETHTTGSPQSWTGTPASTEQTLTKPDYLQRRVLGLFASAAEEVFEEGTEPLFAKELVALIMDHGNAAVAALESALETPGKDVEVAREVLRWLGVIDHSQSRRYRRAVLEKYLEAPSARLRYAAALGLAEMDDPAAIPALAEAIRTEPHDKIRWHFQLVLDQLENTKRCPSS
jgi:HEAT repeat protein